MKIRHRRIKPQNRKETNNGRIKGKDEKGHGDTIALQFYNIGSIKLPTL